MMMVMVVIIMMMQYYCQHCQLRLGDDDDCYGDYNDDWNTIANTEN